MGGRVAYVCRTLILLLMLVLLIMFLRSLAEIIKRTAEKLLIFWGLLNMSSRMPTF